MRKGIILLCAIVFIASCTSSSNVNSSVKKSLRVTGVSEDSKYGVTEKKAIKVGGQNPENERAYLNQLAGPNGEIISYRRTGSCCPFKTPNGIFDSGLLDRYEVTWKGSSEKVYIYINMYDPPKEDLLAPKGMTVKQ